MGEVVARFHVGDQRADGEVLGVIERGCVMGCKGSVRRCVRGDEDGISGDISRGSEIEEGTQGVGGGGRV